MRAICLTKFIFAGSCGCAVCCMEKNKQFSKLYDQIEKAYKDGKITKIQYDKNMEKLLKDFSD